MRTFAIGTLYWDWGHLILFSNRTDGQFHSNSFGSLNALVIISASVSFEARVRFASFEILLRLEACYSENAVMLHMLTTLLSPAGLAISPSTCSNESRNTDIRSANGEESLVTQFACHVHRLSYIPDWMLPSHRPICIHSLDPLWHDSPISLMQFATPLYSRSYSRWRCTKFQSSRTTSFKSDWSMSVLRSARSYSIHPTTNKEMHYSICASGVSQNQKPN